MKQMLHFFEIDKCQAEQINPSYQNAIPAIKAILIDECIKIYGEMKQSDKRIPCRFRIIYNPGLSAMEDCFQTDMIEDMWEWNNGKLSSEGVPGGFSADRLHENGRYFSVPEMHFNIDLKEKKVVLAYYFGKRCARCFSYNLLNENQEYKIANQKVEWVS